jgi:tRNA threonylcarbamoyladenosine modification (KEOPS) complex  Pcc1 subunit
MKLLIELFGEDVANKAYASLQNEVPNMDESYYVRNTIRILNK